MSTPIPAFLQVFAEKRENILDFVTGTDDVEALNRELRPYAALDMVRTSYLHPMNNPQLIAFFKSRITQDLS